MLWDVIAVTCNKADHAEAFAGGVIAFDDRCCALHTTGTSELVRRQKQGVLSASVIDNTR